MALNRRAKSQLGPGYEEIGNLCLAKACLYLCQCGLTYLESALCVLSLCVCTCRCRVRGKPGKMCEIHRDEDKAHFASPVARANFGMHTNPRYYGYS